MMKCQNFFRIDELMNSSDQHILLIEAIRKYGEAACAKKGSDIRLMEVCGTHTMTIAKAGISAVLPKGVKLLSGPGCPVCVTSNHCIDACVALSRLKNVIITTFGDMVRVPGSTTSLAKEKANGSSIRIVYSPLDALEIAKNNPKHEVIFIGIGFETTIPLIANAIKRAAKLQLSNFSVMCAHKTVPPALEALINDEKVKIDAFILPGHVSTVIGLKPYEFLAKKYNIPGVVTGFEQNDVLFGIAKLLKLLADKKASIENAYPRGVKTSGNKTAVSLIDEVFESCDANWRGLGTIKKSGLKIRDEFKQFDAMEKFSPEIEPVKEPYGCRCGDVLRGAITPNECPLFKKVCSPQNPKGPCMVSSEGSCAAFYRYH